MSISLNNHETRISELERKSITISYSEKLIFGAYNQPGVEGGSYSIAEPYTNFKALRICSSRSRTDLGSAMQQYVVTLEELIASKGLVALDTDSGHCQIIFKSNTDFDLTLGGPDWLYLIYGLKWGGGYKLWNFIKKIYSLYQNILKSISLSFIGGEVI